ncbi:hypothetical protein Acr_28g0011510 [Actinidia rufa]|uniref:Uncharacterized protein n=1 Tax=Actinidia rufa TaxID=165716 RepID=A0A7J0HBJ0_9ERIC|nr:hypothetical protein Acr_28g0011510 [Actinidia rufa]
MSERHEDLSVRAQKIRDSLRAWAYIWVNAVHNHGRFSRFWFLSQNPTGLAFSTKGCTGLGLDCTGRGWVGGSLIAQGLHRGCAGGWLVAAGCAGAAQRLPGGCGAVAQGCTEAAQEAGLVAAGCAGATQEAGGCLVAAQVAVQGCAGG